MHEAGLARNALEAALEHAQNRGAGRIHRVTMKVGDLSGVVPESLRFAFQSLAEGTLASDAEVDVEVVPVECFCAACHRVFRPTDIIYVCPDCGRLSADVRQGDELVLESIEVS